MESTANSGNEPPLVAHSSGSATLASVQPGAGAEVEFRRLSGHARVIGAGILLAGKLGILGFVGAIWFATVANAAGSAGELGTLAWIGFWAAASVIVVHVLLGGVRWRAAWSGGTTLLCISGFALLRWMLRPWWMPWWSTGQLWLVGIMIALGGLVGHLLISAVLPLCNRLRVGGYFRGLVPTLGLDPHGSGYRAEVETFLLSVERAFAGGLASLRTISICGLALLVLAVAMSLGEAGSDFASTWTKSHITGIGVCLVVGGSVGVITALLLIPARPRLMLVVLPGMVGGLGAVGVLLGILFGRRVDAAAAVMGPMVEIVIVASAAAVCVYFVVRFLAVLILGRFLPKPVCAHIAIPHDMVTAMPPPSPAATLGCEMCGYQLEGLPPTICPTCGVEVLRCPECGHQQPASTLHARLLLRLCRWHLAVRTASWLAAIAFALLILLPWYAIGASAGGRSLFWGNNKGIEEVTAIILICFVLIAPLRVLCMHWRPLILTSLLLPVLPLIAMCLGGWLSWSRGGPPSDTGALAIIWLAASVVTPPLWRAWLWLMLGTQAGDVWAWHTSRAFRRGDAGRMVNEASTMVAAWPSGRGLSRCAACGVLHSDEAGGAVSLARIAFESFVHRTRQMLLAITGAKAAAACGLLFIVLMVYGSDIRYTGAAILGRGELPPVALVAMCTGALLRTSTMRWNTVVSSLVGGSVTAFWFAAPVIFGAQASGTRPGLMVGVSAMVMMAAFIGALLAVPVLTLASRLLLPIRTAKALIAWLRGERTLDAAANTP